MKYPHPSVFFIRTRLLALLSVPLLLLATLLLSGPSYAQSKHSLTHLAPTPNSLTVIVLDMSGSMQTNDPQGFRCSAANSFIDLSGIGNYISVIGLDGDPNKTGGSHNFDLASLWTPDPVDMSVQRNRDGLKQTIKDASHNCAPDKTTPTYDALSKALTILQTNALPKELPGSVILLTDGTPDDGNGLHTVDQINAIQTELLPQFKQHNWPIDTVALGENGTIVSGTQFNTFHDFLQAISNSTTGKFYDDSHGIVPGTNALNIGPFFTDIFARYNHRTVKDDIPPTTLNGGMTPRNFTVTPYTDHLDIVAVKDNANTSVTLKDANGATVIPQAHVFVYTDPYYVIFSIDTPQQGSWELDVTGSGQFLMKSLKISQVTLANLQLTENGQTVRTNSPVLALGQPIGIKTQLIYQQHPIIDTTYTMQGTVSYNGIAGAYQQSFALRGDSSGTYTGSFSVPESQPSGSYQILVTASIESLDNIIGSQLFTARIELFPTPMLVEPSTGIATLNTVNIQAVQWDPALQFLYNLPFVSRLYSWPLQGHPAGKALAKGEVRRQSQPYAGASITAQSTSPNNQTPVSAVISEDGNGHFHVEFPVSTSNLYNLTFNTSGTFTDTHGDSLLTQSHANVTLIPPTPLQEGFAWLITLCYLGILIIILNLLRFFALAHPHGGYATSHDGEIAGSFSFTKATRNPLQWYFQPDLIYSQQAKMPAGLLFRFRHGGGIEIRPEGPGARNWQTGDGGRLNQQFIEERELRYRPASFREDEEAMGATYLIQPKNSGRSSRRSYYDDDQGPSSRQKRSFYDDEDSRYSRRGQRSSYDDDDYSSRNKRSSRSQKNRRSRREYDDE